MDSNKRPDSMARITTNELANAFIDEQVVEVFRNQLRAIIIHNCFVFRE